MMVTEHSNTAAICKDVSESLESNLTISMNVKQPTSAAGTAGARGLETSEQCNKNIDVKNRAPCANGNVPREGLIRS